MKVKLEANKTYKTQANAEKVVVDGGFDQLVTPQGRPIRWFIGVNAEGRFFPVFIGEDAVQNGLHLKFTIIG